MGGMMNNPWAGPQAPTFTDSVTVYGKTKDQIIAEEIERRALERAAQKIEAQAGNAIYEKAWKAAAKLVRSLKP